MLSLSRQGGKRLLDLVWNATICIVTVLYCVYYCIISFGQSVVCRWYFGKIKRIEAEKKLLQADNEHGSFLIRDSESRHHDFSLSSMHCVEGVSYVKRADVAV